MVRLVPRHKTGFASKAGPERHVFASPNQARYVKGELSGTGTYMIAVGHLVDGKFDEAAFKRAIEHLLKRHEALRTRFEMSKRITAVISGQTAHQYHLCRTEPQDLAAFRSWALPLVFHDVDPRKPGSLIRFLVADMGTSWRFTIAAHHAITDGVSRNLMNKELMELYAGETLETPGSYYDFTERPEQNPQLQDAVDDFVDQLPVPARINADGTGTESGEYVEQSLGDIAPQLTALAKSLSSSKFGFLTAVYALCLRGFSGEDRVSSFFQSAGRRSLAAPNDVVGSFSNTLPLDLSVDLDCSFAGFAQALLSQTKYVLALENAPLLETIMDRQKAPHVSINMFPPEVPITAASLKVGPREYLDRRTEFDLNMVWSEEGGALTARAFYASSHMSRSRAQQFLDLQSRLIATALEDPHLSCRDLIQKARQGAEVILAPKNLDPDPDSRLHAAFFDIATRSPDLVAIRTSSETITYSALADLAREIAHGLASAGIGEGDRVAILAQRHPKAVAAMLGASASGASFALIDARYPATRIKAMLESLQTRTVIEAGAVLPPQLKELVTCIDPISKGASELVIDSGPPRREAYHLFTSGTTGRPKLTSHPDKTVQRFIHWLQQNFTELDTPATIMMAGLAHDPMLRDVFWPLNSGGYIAIPTPCEMTRPAELRNLIKQARCNCVRFSASTAQLLTTAMPDTEQFSDVQAILWGGERLPIDVARKWQDLAPGARQFNVYGTTETPQAVMIHEISKEQSWGRDIALGRPLPWSGIRLIDTDGRPVSRGELGEIVVNLPDPVAGSFRRFATDSAPEDRVHYTGDLGYQAPDGNIYFAGRSDDQVKINGYRIELREVETAAERVPGIERASVVIVDDRLSLFAQTSSSDVTIRSLRAALTQNLPDYMVPANIYIVPDLPCTANGKIDRAALSIKAQNPAVPSADAADLTPPRTPLEHSIAQVFAHQARQARIGREHSLSDLGADSLAAIETRLKLEKLGLILSDAWQWASVAELAAQNAARPEPRTLTANTSTLQRTEMFILLRCIAILAIVAFHTGFRVTGGASIVLFVLAGYSFVQLQLPAILNDGHPRRVWALMTRLLIPLVPMSLIYLGYDIYRDVATDPSSMLFYRNLTEVINAVLAPGTDPVEGLAWLWFLHAYLQIFLIFGLLLSSSWIRTALAQDLWRRLLMFFIIAEGISILSLLGMAQLVDQSADVGNILHRNPIALIPFLIVGGLVAAARTTSRQVISFAVVALHIAVVAQFYADHNELWWVLALVLCALCPFVSLPKSMSKLAIAIAAYSLMIYLTHHAVFIVMHKLIGGSDLARVASVFAQIGFGVVFGYLMRPVIARFSAPRQTDAIAQST